ncbi:NADPH-dependent FMN reductase [Leptospira limi]|uniref:NAD(P)H-dependent oxidoreductase n=1 Tax=Leptospira limi TaxID=2950023 RepID=A0ABT3LV38_9LEPT|nr:NADPH-dependent FMN reductase [Leptospira limi]MCW7461587.1 NAD(P)H-dependent oxidoreductase [Leptospira limi]
MKNKKPVILAITGGISLTSYNRKILNTLKVNYKLTCDMTIYDEIIRFPFFDSGISEEGTPDIIKEFLGEVKRADGILICSPEYVFSIPGVLKNALEWAVSSVVFTDKPVAVITAASVGQKAHESLLLVLKTIGAKLTDDTSLLISGVKGKVSLEGEICDEETDIALQNLMHSFLESIS